jgi:hypothetical protein
MKKQATAALIEQRQPIEIIRRQKHLSFEPRVNTRVSDNFNYGIFDIAQETVIAIGTTRNGQATIRQKRAI